MDALSLRLPTGTQFKYGGKRKSAGKTKKESLQEKKMRRAILRELKVRGLSRPELKHSDINFEATQFPTVFTGTGTGILPTSQDTTITGFVGDKITLKYLDIRGWVYNGLQDEAADSYVCRLLIVVDNQPQNAELALYGGGTSNVADNILDNPNVMAHYIIRDPMRFSVLWDESWAVPPRGTELNRRLFMKKIDLKNMEISFTKNVGVNAWYPLNKNIYVFAVAEAAELYFRLNTRIVFTDV